VILAMDALAEAKLLAAGIVSNGVIHEVANLLTVLDGQIQIRELAGGGPRTGRDPLELLQSPAHKCRDVVEAFRACFAYVEPIPYPVPWESEIRALVPVVKLRLRARATEIEVPDESSQRTLPGAFAARTRIAVLCAILGLLEHARAHDRYPSRIRFELAGKDSTGAVLAVRLFGFERAQAGHAAEQIGSRMVGLAERVMTGTPLRLQVAAEATAAAIELLVRD
jgi:hypothetical protein